MSSSTIPISNSGPSNSTAATSQPQFYSSPALQAFWARLSGSIRQAFALRRPWLELVDRTAISRPDTLSTAVSRIRKNYTYFRINYLTILGAVQAFSLLTHPFSLLLLLTLLAAWLFLYIFRSSDQPVTIYGRTFTDRETLGLLILFTVIVVFLTSIGSLIMSATLVGVIIVCVHGAFRVPEDLFLDHQDQAVGANVLFPFMSGAASSAAAVAARV